MGCFKVLALLTAATFANGQQSTAPHWQIDAGGKQAFNVASVKLATGEFRTPLFALDNGDAFAETGGRFFAQFPLITYIGFGWKIRPTREQDEAMLANLPKWITTDRYEIEARASGNPTKDQMRLMVQSLLAERFHVALHFETRESALLTLTLVKPGKPGPNLRPHSEGLMVIDHFERPSDN